MLNPIKFLQRLVKSSNQIELDRLQKILTKVNELEETVSSLNDNNFKLETVALKKKISDGASLDEVLPKAYALVREASKRVRNERHFDVQIIGGIVLHEGKIAEMKTGEGKTLTIALAAYLNSLTEKGVHIVTVNDYLAKRDCEDMSKIYNFLGLTEEKL